MQKGDTKPAQYWTLGILTQKKDIDLKVRGVQLVVLCVLPVVLELKGISFSQESKVNQMAVRTGYCMVLSSENHAL